MWRHLYCGHGPSNFLRNVGNRREVNTTSHSTRLQSELSQNLYLVSNSTTQTKNNRLLLKFSVHARARNAGRCLLTARNPLASYDIRGAHSSVFLGLPLLVAILPLLHTHLSPSHEVCNSPDQAANFHTLGPTLGASSLIWKMDGFIMPLLLFRF